MALESIGQSVLGIINQGVEGAVKIANARSQIKVINATGAATVQQIPRIQESSADSEKLGTIILIMLALVVVVVIVREAW